MVNPLYGYSIESVKAVQANTVVYRIRSEIYKQFLHPDNSPKWGERELQNVFPPQIRLEGSTKKQQKQLLNQFNIKQFEPTDILLKQGEVADEIYIILSGEIMVLG